MSDLAEPIELAMSELGFREEGRKFVPHLTIGRVRSAPRGIERLAAALREYTDASCGLVEVHEVVVFSSRLSPDGPEYTPLGRAPLEG
jgi:2'-5' RNA ligase